ncbi:uncharacterized protein BDCG_04183 [Blastomyces dermatitidis ER-3]|uniref:Uncharacterized protein n=1 Tax=Ajellomyces dermatitidis (strain ER-3 / ATCC MYA-2586) TaxID=559297 RepID=A0ABP2EXZ0_AJEDR|nr:uncharacterized protein BDCG_04183 [Blastomyces dermatitidis ER-3]EEQ89063.1 hypothetical protein BDCG_04183 [Blastomyces dermatitidis ER-3]
MRSYITVLAERESGVTTAAERAEKELNMNKSTGRRNNTSLQDMATTAAAAREAGEEEEEDVTMRVILLQSVNTAIFTFNQAFLTVMKTAAALQRCLLTRKCQNKSLIIL